MQHIRQIRQQAINHGVHLRFGTEMMIVIQNQNQLLINPLQHFIQEHINRALRMFGQFTRTFLQIGKHCLAKARHHLLNTGRDVTKEDKRICVGMV